MKHEPSLLIWNCYDTPAAKLYIGKSEIKREGRVRGVRVEGIEGGGEGIGEEKEDTQITTLYSNISKFSWSQ